MIFIVLLSLVSALIDEDICSQKEEFEEKSGTYPFSLIDLPYSGNYELLEPTLSKEILEAHHDHHHYKYVDKLNSFLADNEELQTLTLVELQYEAKNYLSLEKHAGGDYNHRMYWWILMNPYCSSKEPSTDGNLRTQINSDFGSFEDFKIKFEDTSKNLFGSGWATACVNSDGHIEVRETEEQINTLMEISGDICYPFFVNDVWEHAYYLEYLWDRGLYVSEYWNIVDWDIVEMFYDQYASLMTPVPLG